MHRWKSNGWKTAQSTPVSNRNLWEKLLYHVGKLADIGCEVLFWRIPRALSEVTNQAAKGAARLPSFKKYSEIAGIMC